MRNKDFIPYGSDPKMDRLVDNKEDYFDRIDAAEAGYALDILKNDNVEDVRCAVAEKHYFLKDLADDKSGRVKATIAINGDGLDKYYDDYVTDLDNTPFFEYKNLHELCKCVLEDAGYISIGQWILQNPSKCLLPDNVVAYQISKLKDLVHQANKKYDLSCIEGLYDFSRELYHDYKAEIEFNEGLPVEVCVSSEINEPVQNWKISRFMDLQHINFNGKHEIEDFCCERYDLQEAIPEDFTLSVNKKSAPQRDVVKNAQVADKVANKDINKKI